MNDFSYIGFHIGLSYEEIENIGPVQADRGVVPWRSNYVVWPVAWPLLGPSCPLAQHETKLGLVVDEP